MTLILRLLRVAATGALLLTILTIGVALGQGEQLGGKLRTGSDVTIPATETVDHDLYVFGGTLTSNGTINGDVVVAGGTITLNGPVKDDVLAAGGQVMINGPVGGDVRAAGGQIHVAGDVTEDVVVTGGQMTLTGKVGQDLIAAGGTLDLAGSVAGGAAGSVGTYTKTGTVAGTDSIVVTGNQANAFTPPASNPVLDAIRQFIEVMLVAIIATWLLPRAYAAAGSIVRDRPLPSFGWGFVAAIAYFVIVIVFTVSVIVLAGVFALLGFGALVGIDLFGGFLLVAGFTFSYIVVAAFVADAIVGLALARLLAGGTGGPLPAAGRIDRARWSELGLLAVGVAVVVILTSLPLVGGWIKLVVVLLGLGSIWLAWRRRGGDMIAPPEPGPSAPPAPAG